MRRRSSRGFSLIELMITLVVLGLVLAISIPAFRGLSATHQLKSSVQNIAGQLRLAREKAIGTNVMQTVHFYEDYLNSDYHIHNGSIVDPKWSLPRGITYYWGAGTEHEFHMTSSGRCQDSGMIILQDAKGHRDTVSVQLSGIVLTR